MGRTGTSGPFLYFWRKKIDAAPQGNTCSEEFLVRQRAVQRIDRMEIVDHHRKEFVALNPATGLPYEFIFVDNLSSSNGTIESPYPTLLQAEAASVPYNIFYVFHSRAMGRQKG